MKQACRTTTDQNQYNEQCKNPELLCQHNSKLKVLLSFLQENKTYMHNRDKGIPTKGSNTRHGCHRFTNLKV